ncbi:MAG TPA: multicopper oxidase domain-containing protein [Polyangiaceae bacterium]|nr:multicopper oxidase domain-containing protein [Polyangiaceae bacterium]
MARFAVRFDDRPGPWMIHCHILDHTEVGLSATIDLQP